jgi:hypothetical protein
VWLTVAKVVPIAATIALIGFFGELPPAAIIVSLALCGATVGFAFFNRPTARLFSRRCRQPAAVPAWRWSRGFWLCSRAALAQPENRPAAFCFAAEIALYSRVASVIGLQYNVRLNSPQIGMIEGDG